MSNHVMSNQSNAVQDNPESQSATNTNDNQSFDAILSQFEKSKSAQKPADTSKGREGTVISITADSVVFEIGFKTEGAVLLTEFQSRGETPKPGDKFFVAIKGRDPEGYYELTLGKIARPNDWPASCLFIGSR